MSDDLETVDPEIIRQLGLPGPSELASLVDPTEDNVARAFESQYANQLRYCNAWGQWYIWDKCRWAPERTLLAFHYARILSRDANTSGSKTPAKASFARGVESLARSSRTFSTVPEQWDQDSMLFNCPANTQDLRTGELRRHRKGDHITKCARVAPEPGPHPVFDRFLKDITLEDDDLADYHKRSLGACLSGAIKDNFLLFWYGTGQNGKNTLGDLIEWILGDYAKVIPAETLMADKHGSRHPTDLANLRGVRLAISSEVEEGSYFNEQRLKSLTGDATISARFMRQDFFEFPRTHKHLVYGNHRPLLRVVDPALRARLHIVPFKAHFPPDARDPDMARKLRAEAPQILAWLIEGHQEWLEEGRLTPCSAVQAETESYFESQSTPDMWVAECCDVGDGRYAAASDLYKSYKAWKESRGEGAVSQTRWGEWMSVRYRRNRRSGGIWYEGLDLTASASWAANHE
jgi:putative DNA primase/helicase